LLETDENLLKKRRKCGMGRKSKGINAERELMHRIWEKGCPAVRVAGSGAIKYPAPDIIAGTENGKIAIEVKASSGNAVYIEKEQVDDLLHFASIFGAEAWIAAKFTGRGWAFLHAEELSKLKNSYKITEEDIGNGEFWERISAL
jgi:Holliday junction resolvase